MSYSFTVKAETKVDAKAKVAEQLDLVIQNQPAHKGDRDAALAAAGAFIDLLMGDAPEGREIVVGVHGSLSWVADAPAKYTSASVGISASYRTID